MYLLRVKGIISLNKKREFDQSLRLLVEQFPPKWHAVYVANDIIQQDVYYFDSVWESKEELNEFMDDQNYKVLMGAFKVLGDHFDRTISEIKHIEEVKKMSK